ncbi:hypothetical protein B0I32_14059 [Nonomuraea fuscirosea]|uniref:Uncharacterized protein n=1 Tax=Nonomuraea fuscirosea TaxID=1291556 RepID=A0A2T0LXR8_9ACTN|nr:hypothetical protein [Nonomuraea fuscirosea]PRX48814.1 hypothetical protein B0I32_14059 [Nonomuraea fuscirosea]
MVEVGARQPHHQAVLDVLGSRRGGEFRWDGETLGPWAAEMDGGGIVVCLAGRSVNCRNTPALRAVMDWRV